MANSERISLAIGISLDTKLVVWFSIFIRNIKLWLVFFSVLYCLGISPRLFLYTITFLLSLLCQCLTFFYLTPPPINRHSVMTNINSPSRIMILWVKGPLKLTERDTCNLVILYVEVFWMPLGGGWRVKRWGIMGVKELVKTLTP